ncbi:TPA: hypothetical protein SMN51_005651 [Pseudomonas aeruginosa]|nr:hypothetical protein [Pseudomonas aeruginosa]
MSDKPWIIEAGGRRWLVREAVSEQAAMDAITMARLSGAVGHRNVIDKRFVGGGEEVQADVVQINSDGTERQPYTEPY